MRYAILLYQDEELFNGLDETERQGVFREYFALRSSMQQAGQFVDGVRLKPVATATSVRIRAGEMLVTDGPFADTKEQFAGYWIVEAEHLDQALEAARRMPAARFGTVEVRPIEPMPAAPPAPPA